MLKKIVFLVFGGALAASGCGARPSDEAAAPSGRSESLALKSGFGRAPEEPRTKPTEQTRGAPSAPSPSPPAIFVSSKEIEDRVAQAIAQGRIPGCVVAVGTGDGLAFLEAFGNRALEPAPEPMTTDTRFDLASLTKPIATASAAFLLRERGTLELDEAVAATLPAFDVPGKRGITVRHLLMHVSGLPAVSPLRHYTSGMDEAISHFGGLPLESRPKERFRYSDVGFIALGALLDKKTTGGFEQLLREALWEPLRMTSTGFGAFEAQKQRTAPTTLRDDEMIRGVVQDPRAYRLGGVAGNAGLFSTAEDLALFARMLLRGGRLEGRRVLFEESVQLMEAPAVAGAAWRTLGWDVQSGYSRSRPPSMGPRAFGHTGYTGTAVWIDPDLDLFVIFLSNRVHPEGTAPVHDVVADIGDVAVQAAAPRRKERQCFEAGRARPGIDGLLEDGFAALADLRVGLVTNNAARTRDGRRTLDVLAESPRVKLVKVFSPEHGLDARLEGHVRDGEDAGTGLEVISLFGKKRVPSKADVADIDVIVFDLQDAGVRYFTYTSTLYHILERLSGTGKKVVVLDRPNPMGGMRLAGPPKDPRVETFVNYYDLPVMHGMTAGELARMFVAEQGFVLDLVVVPVERWRVDLGFDETGLDWHPPSPNLRSFAATMLYPCVGLLESTNISVGRGTKTPFEVLGAPWLKADELARALEGEPTKGLEYDVVEFEPKQSRYAGKTCRGLRFRVTNLREFEPVKTAMLLSRHLMELHRGDWQYRKLIRLVAHGETLRNLEAGRSLDVIERAWQSRLDAFQERRSRHLLYPRLDCSGSDAGL